MIRYRHKQLTANSFGSFELGSTMVDQLLASKEANGLSFDDIKEEANVMIAAVSIIYIILILLSFMF